MTLAETLLPLAVLVPLGMAGLVLALAHWLRPRLADVAALATTVAVTVLCGWLAHEAAAGPVIHWFGGWTPSASGRPDVTLGIAFSADAASAGVAAFCGLIFGASLLFAWHYFDEVHAHFHVLMLAFLAAIVGFCLTRDLFDLFVWFELMSVAAYALTAYPLGPSSLEGAFNFTVVNSLASFMLLLGIGLIYARTGALDYLLIQRAVAGAGGDPVVLASFVLIAVALMTKGAIVPFHFWLADAHSVAPSPVSVVFSGAMVGVALFGLAKLIAGPFGSDAVIVAAARDGLPALGAATAVIAALTAWAQRHLKRLLAFSTIAHLGIMLTGLAAARSGSPGMLLYLVGHGLVKGGLFMIAGILLALRASVDEIDLYARGRRLWPVGIVMAAAGLLLGGLPIGLLHGGSRLIELAADGHPAVRAAQILATTLTGAAVLRAGLRIFVGVSGVPGPERDGAAEREHEKNDRPLWLMLLPCALLVALASAPADVGIGWVLCSVAGNGPAAPVPAESAGEAFGPILATLLLVAVAVMRKRPTRSGARAVVQAETGLFAVLQRTHSGMIGDYGAWLAVGVAGLAWWLALPR